MTGGGQEDAARGGLPDEKGYCWNLDSARTSGRGL